jgi:hypothetical protein
MQGGGSVTFFRLWLVGIYNPARSAEELKAKPAPLWGFAAVVIRFFGTVLATGVRSGDRLHVDGGQGVVEILCEG